MANRRIPSGPQNLYHTDAFGDFYVIGQSGFTDKFGHPYYKIKFLNTGTEIDIRGTRIMTGQVKDPYYPFIYGVACKGNVPPIDSNFIIRKSYAIWHNILSRLFNKNNRDYYAYGALGISISKEWLCFENFLNDLPSLPGYDLWLKDHTKYQLDKDKLQIDKPIGERIYSKETCCFIPNSENRIYNSQSINSSSKYNGVIYDKNRKKYKAGIRTNKGIFNIGRFDNEEAAAVAFNHFAEILGDRVLNEGLTMSYSDAINNHRSGGALLLYKVIKKDILDDNDIDRINSYSNAGYTK